MDRQSRADSKPRILILATGGTIASVPAEDGLSPGYSVLELLGWMGAQLDEYDVIARDILQLDSSNIQPEEWQLIAREIAQAADTCDGVVLTHGTDTMAYTASVLSFMLQGIRIPVVLTGSQLPITDPVSDAPDNLALAMAFAASKTPGVYLAFNRQIILGTRAVKVRTTDFNAFESINYPLIGLVNGDGLRIRSELVPSSRGPFELRDSLDPSVFLLKLTPGLDPMIFPALRGLDYRALVIEAFGIGGIHYLHRDLIGALEDLIGSVTTVVVTSQCLYEQSDFSRYETGRRLLDIGALPAFDMTTEACVTKLIWILGQTHDPGTIAELFRQNLAGELRPLKTN